MQHKEPKLWSRNFIFIIMTSLFTFVGFQMLLPTVPVFAKKLGGSDAEAGLVVGIFALSALLVRPLSGYALDRFGRKELLFAGLIIFIISVIAYHWAITLALLLLIRFIHGFGWGISSTAASTTATDIIPRQRLGEGMGFYGLAGTISMALAPAAGLWVMEEMGFSVLFTIAASIAAAGLGIALWIQYPTIPLAQNKSMVLVEQTAFVPAVVIFFLTMTYGAVVSFLALYALEQNIGSVGYFFSVYAAALLMVRPFAGRLSDKVGFDVLVIPGIGAVMGAMVVVSMAHSLTGFLIAAALYGIGFGALVPCLQAMSVMNTPPERRGAANGTFFTGFDLGIALGSLVWGWVAQAVGYSAMFLWTVIPAAISLFIYVLKRPKIQRGGTL